MSRDDLVYPNCPNCHKIPHWQYKCTVCGKIVCENCYYDKQGHCPDCGSYGKWERMKKDPPPSRSQSTTDGLSKSIGEGIVFLVGRAFRMVGLRRKDEIPENQKVSFKKFLLALLFGFILFIILTLIISALKSH